MENVGALTVRGLDRVLGSLAEIGYDAVWQDIRASDVGAPHRRERIWIIAWPSDWNPDGKYEQKKPGICGGENANAGGIRRYVAYSGCTGIYKPGIPENAGGSGRQPGGIFRNGLQSRKEESGILADSQEQQRPIEGQETSVSGRGGQTLADAGNIWSVEWQRKLRSDKQVIRTGENNGGRTEIDAIREWWAVEPPVCCLVDGLPPGMDGYEGRICNNAYRRASQLKGLGNAIVPHIAMLIWLMIKNFYD
jgi:DNA (cytosine-5)-methyltransferase 1